MAAEAITKVYEDLEEEIEEDRNVEGWSFVNQQQIQGEQYK